MRFLGLVLLLVGYAECLKNVRLHDFVSSEHKCKSLAVFGSLAFPAKYQNCANKKCTDIKDERIFGMRDYPSVNIGNSSAEFWIDIDAASNMSEHDFIRKSADKINMEFVDNVEAARKDDRSKVALPLWSVVTLGMLDVYGLCMTILVVLKLISLRRKANKTRSTKKPEDQLVKGLAKSGTEKTTQSKTKSGSKSVASSTESAETERTDRSQKSGKSTKSGSKESSQSSRSAAGLDEVPKSLLAPPPAIHSQVLSVPCDTVHPSVKIELTENGEKPIFLRYDDNHIYIAKEEVLRSDEGALRSSEPIEPPLRDIKNIITTPVTTEEFEFYLHNLIRFAVDYYEDSAKYAVTTCNRPGSLFDTTPREAPANPEPFTTIMKDLKTQIMPGMTHWQHPQFHGYFPTGRCYPDIMAEFLTATLSCVGFSWDSCPASTELEQVMVNWIGRAFGIPESHLFSSAVNFQSGGILSEASSEALLNTILAARHAKIIEKLGPVATQSSQGIHYNLSGMHDVSKNFVVYASSEAFSYVEKICKMAMVKCRVVTALKRNDFGITGEQLEKEILKDCRRGLVPIFAICTVGTNSLGSSDDLKSMATICQKYGIWLHVDASYGGSYWIDPQNRKDFESIKIASSIAVDLHKSFLHSSTVCAVFTTRKADYKEMFRIHPPYLKPNNAEAMDMRDYGLALSHRFKSLKTFFIMRLYGISGLRGYINKAVSLCKYFESHVAAHPNLRIFSKTNFSVFSFQYHEAGMSEVEISRNTRALAKYIRDSHKVFFSTAKVSNEYYVIRVAVGVEPCHTKASVDASWSYMQDLIEEFKQRRADLKSSDSQMSTGVGFGVIGSRNEDSFRGGKMDDKPASTSQQRN